ncbi:sulfate adenylyltransferase subunit 1 [Chitinophaga terrae (ex Kim and Jung 2007)]|jgi:sulfate adenylyltransferase subunit 1|uniref:sulfate adenylyltransferase n=1 Tax=Chitinophaga terrae (ex Kim and Jung 2007) TaxID=408074 RepID=A0A1H4FWR4_9BACT|nr:GTP-binding protein [Chitinophaga terrae (ex Kim and Jung 2007)]MDQ0108166.1 sulfate adenylyltransferase subunit 1 [Chitinophaga terrae (ex Kim and Jung 2007)]GEP92757.1 sulfate adenylyltransferase subunit 1 [Chitinophaga terrae (ex Kim and Jung 2007)]SEB01793.1 sulfate adenylyltransferase subunit 1 [Chitinophaga terrae (ex Kim and Jung 2007)]
MEVLRIATSGSVDDGKSTLIGRLLYDTNSIPQDKMEALHAASKRKGLDYTDLSLLTDGLVAEREQGITIDVAHIYFSTPTRKYIIADTPGHIEYTRNMVTGASNAQVSLILIDARKGIVEQTHRHFFIANLLRIPYLVVCVNKMDLVEYNQARFNQIVEDFQQVLDNAGYKGQSVQFIPISSLYGENVASRTGAIDWYEGPSLLEYLEGVSFDHADKQHPARFPIQSVIRPRTTEYHDFRGFAGKVASGQFRVGDEVISLPSGQKSRIKTIEQFEKQLEVAHAKESVVITLEDEIDSSRGNMLVKSDAVAEPLKELTADICWMDQQKLAAGKTYLLQHGVNRVKAKVSQINFVTDVTTLTQHDNKTEMGLNDIGRITLRTAAPVFADKYADNPANGAFILIDEFNNTTVGVGFVI